MQTAQLTGCTACQSLRSLYSRIECTMVHLMLEQSVASRFGLETGSDPQVYDKLVHYKRIILRKIYNNEYLAGIDIEDIKKVVTPLLGYKPCNWCAPNTFSVVQTTTTSSTTTTTTSTNME